MLQINFVKVVCSELGLNSDFGSKIGISCHVKNKAKLK